MADYIDWRGQSGRSYRYWFHSSIAPPSADLKKVAGNYMYVRQTRTGGWLPVYIGQADDVSARLPSHERLADAKKADATHLMTHTATSGEQTRLDEERDLIQYWNPPLNTQHRKVS
jgi:predicted GIY-YIG superfamily endonuclease